MPVLALLFFATALLYSAVGFGGGSTYNALLVLARTDFRAVPAVALTCNILVVLIGSRRFATAGHVQWRRIWPLFTLSVPMAWVGGRIMVSEALFVGLLAASLFVAGVTMLWRSEPEDLPVAATRATWAEPLIGGGLGFLAGIVGIGGGIFLAPILHLLRWGRSKAIAATCSVFILVNSVPADWRLLPTLLRFDPVYHTHFRCNGARLIEYPHLLRYTKDLYEQPGIAETFSLEEVKRHYYTTHDELNPKRIIPAGPLDLGFTAG